MTNQAEHVRSPFEDETAEEVRSVLKREQKNKSPQPVQRAPADEKPPLSFRYVLLTYITSYTVEVNLKKLTRSVLRMLRY